MRVWILSCVCLFLAGCGTTTTEASPESKSVEKIRPVFSADSAYAYIERQVAFGPRVPGTISHVDCGDWLVNELHRHGLYVEVQKGTMLNYAGEDQEISNIVGFFCPLSFWRNSYFDAISSFLYSPLIIFKYSCNLLVNADS